MTAIYAELHLITFGLGPKFDPQKFLNVQNRNHMKPYGGLWASPVGCRYGWAEWCDENDFGDLSENFETKYAGRTIIIDQHGDLAKLPWRNYSALRAVPDYEALIRRGVDAVYVTERGEQATRFTEPGLYGYDCECVLVLNPNCLVDVSL